MNATEAFSKLLMADSDEKFFMTWIVVNQAIARGDADTAGDLLKRHPRFADDTFGREALARLAIMNGDGERAAEIYASVEAESSEARIFLARRAFNHQQWDEATRLTESLLEQHPESTVLQDLLQAIVEASARSEATAKSAVHA